MKFGKKGADFWEKITFFRDLLVDNVWSHRIMSDLTQTMSDLIGHCPSDSFSPTFIHCFGRILLTGCLFDLILILLAL
jgi:hypothetical protein